MKIQHIIPFLFLLLLIVLPEMVDAQCVMCKATAESGSDGGERVAKGLNQGIIYLMGFPYILLMVLLGVFFRKRIRSFFHQFISLSK